jgi:hypothetical protein
MSKHYTLVATVFTIESHQMNLDPYTAGPLKEVVELVSILMRPPRSCHLLIKSPCLVEHVAAHFILGVRTPVFVCC